VVNTEALHVGVDLALVDQLLLQNRVQKDCHDSSHPLFIDLLVVREIATLAHNILKEKSSKVLRQLNLLH